MCSLICIAWGLFLLLTLFLYFPNGALDLMCESGEHSLGACSHSQPTSSHPAKGLFMHITHPKIRTHQRRWATSDRSIIPHLHSTEIQHQSQSPFFWVYPGCPRNNLGWRFFCLSEGIPKTRKMHILNAWLDRRRLNEAFYDAAFRRVNNVPRAVHLAAVRQRLPKSDVMSRRGP